MRGTLCRLAFAAAVAGAMGFGGTQALAAPGVAAEGRACSYFQCVSYCWNEGCPPGQRCTGYCDPVLGCVCEYA
ncbi:MAG TPA: hypothetical protein VFR37_07395 [Longimicrobium sp.]|nr:hypothetical protein [Longimicrobium sp.]